MGFEFEEKNQEQKKKDKEEFFKAPDVSEHEDLLNQLKNVNKDTDEEQRVINNCKCWGDF